MEELRLYIVYCSNQPLTSEFTESVASSNEQFSAFLEEERPECRNLPLQGFLVKPLQRLCKYPLLFRVRVRSLFAGSHLFVVACRTYFS